MTRVIIGQEKPSLADLEHYGVKGMKWGVRRQKRLERLQRVATGTGSKVDKATVFLTETSGASIARNGGFKEATAVRARNLEIRKQRILKGEATLKDLLALHGGDVWNTGRAIREKKK